MKRAKPHRGSALLLVLVTIAMLVLATFTYSKLMFTEQRAARMHGRSLQAAALTESGAEAVRQMLNLDAQQRQDAGGAFDNPGWFRGVLVADAAAPEDRGRFAVVAPAIDSGDSSGGVRFGLEDESARLNLNVLLAADEREESGGRLLLMGLPGMTEEVADAILDWLDPDDEPRQYGAEADYYSGQSPPYLPANGPLESVEELLLVRGVTPALLFGPDGNRSGVLDLHEQAAAGVVAAVETVPGELARGWAGYLTLHSAERNVRSDGTPRIDVNQDDLEKLHEELAAVFDRETASFIVAYRQFGPYTGESRGEALGARQLDLKTAATATLQSVLDLVDARVSVKFPEQEQPVVLEPAFPLQQPDAIAQVMEHLTANPQKTIPGRININQAPRAVLRNIPGIDEALADTIVGRRTPETTGDQPARNYETWLLTEGLVTLAEMKALMPYINAGGSVYRAQIVGYFDRLGPAARVEIIVGATADRPRLLSWKELTHLGRGHALETLGIGPLEAE